MSDSDYKNLPVIADEDEDDDGLPTLLPQPKSVSNSKNFTNNVIEQRQGKPEYKLLLLWHILLKLLPDFMYIFCGPMGLNFVSSFIIVVMLLSADFWLTKNVSGRLLAGLRWWNTIDSETESPKWVYESWSAEERQVSRPLQVRTFWLIMVIQQGVWLLFAFMSMIKFNLGWLLIDVVAIALNGANIMGYLWARFFGTNSGRQSFTEKWTQYFSDKLSILLKLTRQRGGGYFAAD